MLHSPWCQVANYIVQWARKLGTELPVSLISMLTASALFNPTTSEILEIINMHIYSKYEKFHHSVVPTSAGMCNHSFSCKSRSPSTVFILQADLPLLDHLEIDRRRHRVRLVPSKALRFVASLQKRGMCGRGRLVRGAFGTAETVLLWEPLGSAPHVSAQPAPLCCKYSRHRDTCCLECKDLHLSSRKHPLILVNKLLWLIAP